MFVNKQFPADCGRVRRDRYDSVSPATAGLFPTSVTIVKACRLRESSSRSLRMRNIVGCGRVRRDRYDCETLSAAGEFVEIVTIATASTPHFLSLLYRFITALQVYQCFTGLSMLYRFINAI